MLELGGADNIPLNGSQTFTVTATDMLGGVPHFGAKMNDNKVTISVQPTDALVVGIDTSSQVELDEDTGMAEFTVYASLDADNGDPGRIIARSGELQDILSITFGMEEPPPPPPLGAPSIDSAMSEAAGMATIMLTPGDNAEKHFVWALAHVDGSVRACTRLK